MGSPSQTKKATPPSLFVPPKDPVLKKPKKKAPGGSFSRENERRQTQEEIQSERRKQNTKIPGTDLANTDENRKRMGLPPLTKEDLTVLPGIGTFLSGKPGVFPESTPEGKRIARRAALLELQGAPFSRQRSATGRGPVLGNSPGFDAGTPLLQRLGQ